MDIGLVGGFAVAVALDNGCSHTCEMSSQSLLLLCLLVLFAALGVWYINSHSGSDNEDKDRQAIHEESTSDHRY
jgi:hypothetical protein